MADRVIGMGGLNPGLLVIYNPCPLISHKGKEYRPPRIAEHRGYEEKMSGT